MSKKELEAAVAKSKGIISAAIAERLPKVVAEICKRLVDQAKARDWADDAAGVMGEVGSSLWDDKELAKEIVTTAANWIVDNATAEPDPEPAAEAATVGSEAEAA